MVSITIYIEGGVLPNDNLAAQTMDNSARLTESFSKLFRSVFEETIFNIKIELAGGEKQAASFFRTAIKRKESAVLLVDVYKSKTKADKLELLELEDHENAVFFMVMEMETWILSQPNIIEKFGEIERLIRKNKDVDIADDKSIKDKDIQTIPKSSATLKTILGRFFDRRPNKKQKYGKLKNAPTMIELLDIKQLQKDFEDVDNLIEYIKSIQKENKLKTK